MPSNQRHPRRSRRVIAAGMPALSFWLRSAGLMLLLLVGAFADPPPDPRSAPGHCTCHEGQGTWEYLRSPLSRPEDPVRCGLLLHGGSCAKRPRPEGTSAECWGSSKAECFWRRHAYSWNIRCSACWDPEACEPCADLLGGPDPLAGTVLAERVASESTSMDGDVVVAVSPHFYVVTNLHRKVKLKTHRGSLRLMTAHEVAHLYAQRCEQAWDDFNRWFGGRVTLPKPMAVYVVDRAREADRIGARYFGKPETRMNYAFNYTDRIAEGFSGNGFIISAEDYRTDNAMHGFARHMIGHILFSCWIVTDGFEERCPRWAWIGAAHFMEKLLPIHDKWATFCHGETAGGEGPTKRWPKRVRDMAKRPMTPIETFFNKNSLSDFSYHDHLRAWSIMDHMLREDRDRWLVLLAGLRDKALEGAAFQSALGVTPEVFHERWVERVLGRRKTLGPVRGDDEPGSAPGRRARARLEEAVEPEILAGRIRGLDVVSDVKLAEVVAGRLDTESDLVRETIHLVLRRTTEPEVLTWLRTEGLADSRPRVRSGITRILGEMQDAEARLAIEGLLDDRDWLVRAEAAHALRLIGDPLSQPWLAEHLDDKNAKAWMAMVDAFVSFGGRSDGATEALVTRLADKAWPVRLTAVRALKRVGTEACLDALVARFAYEGGRLHREFHDTLKVIARDDLGPNPNSWRRWWIHQKKEYGGLPPDLPPPPDNPGDERYGGLTEDRGDGDDDPHYYGRRYFSKSVCFVLDTSGSMEFTMKLRPDQAVQLGKVPSEGSRMEIARAALLHALGKLDPRTRLRLVFFSEKVRLWRPTLVPANTANVAAARNTLEGITPDGETNFYGALEAALGLERSSILDPSLPDVPDTVFFLTDGRPTRGEITSMPELISWVKNLNRYAKVNIHVIALGELNVDIDQLRLLAEAGDGQTIWIQER